jgi:lipopolysaccharide export system permease protein
MIGPAWILAFGLSLVSVWMHDVAYSWGAHGVQRVVIQSLEEVAYNMLRTQRAFANSRFSIIVKDVQGRRLIRPIINFQAHNEMRALTVSAAEAELESNVAKSTMKLILTDCEIEMAGVRSVLPGRTEREFPLAYFSARDIRTGSPAQMPLRQIRGETALQQQLIRQLEQSLAAHSALALVTGELDDLGEPAWAGRRQQLIEARSRLFRLHTEPWRRWAGGFSALAFVLAGAPLAVLLRRGDVMTTFGGLFGGILVAYYPLFVACLDQAKHGTLPPYVVWIPNLLLAAVGLWLLKSVIRY